MLNLWLSARISNEWIKISTHMIYARNNGNIILIEMKVYKSRVRKWWNKKENKRETKSVSNVDPFMSICSSSSFVANKARNICFDGCKEDKSVPFVPISMQAFEKLLSVENYGTRQAVVGRGVVMENGRWENIEFPWDPSDNALIEIILSKLILPSSLRATFCLAQTVHESPEIRFSLMWNR